MDFVVNLADLIDGHNRGTNTEKEAMATVMSELERLKCRNKARMARRLDLELVLVLSSACPHGWKPRALLLHEVGPWFDPRVRHLE